MGSVATVLQKFTKQEGKTLLEGGQKIIDAIQKGTLKETKPAKNLLKVQDKKTAIIDKKKKIDVLPKEQSATTIKKEDFKIKKPKVEDKIADDFLDERKWNVDNRVKAKILRDFNIDKINTKQDVINLIEQISKTFAKDITKQKRGVQTHKVTKQLATLLGKNQKDLTASLLQLQPGSALNAETIFAARELLVSGMNRLDELAVKASDGTVDDVFAFRQHFALMAELQKIVKGVQTETARALNQFKIPTRERKFANVSLDELNKQNLLIELGGEENIRATARLYLDTPNNVKAIKFTDKAGLITKLSDSVAEVFLNVILSNPMTHVRNTAGNWITQGIVSTERRIASTFFGDATKGVAEYEHIAKIYGKHQAYTEMWSAIWKSMKKGKIPHIKNQYGGSKVELRPGAATAANFNLGNGVVGNFADLTGKIVTLNRIPTRFLTVADAYFKNLEFRSELYALAYRDTLKKIRTGVLSKEDASSYLADLVINPTKDMTKAAYDAAHYVTYQTKLGKRGDFLDVGKHAQGIKNKSGWFSWATNYYMPFIQTPTNIAGFTLERMPGLNLLLRSFREDLMAGGARADMAKAKLMLGSAFFMATAPLGVMGYASGSDPDIKLKGKRQMQKTYGYQPKSLRIPYGDEIYQINITGFDPVAMMMGYGSDLGSIGASLYRDHDQWQDYTKVAVAMTLAFGENIASSTFMQGVSKGVNDYQMFKHYGALKGGAQWGKQFGSSFVPTFLKQGGKYLQRDNYNKIAIEFEEYYKRNIAEAEMNTEYDRLGDPIQKFGFITTLKTDPVREELKSLDPKLNSISRTYEVNLGPGLDMYVPMKSKELSILQELTGKLSKIGLEELHKTDEYKNATSELYKETLTKKVFSSAETKARNEMKKDTDLYSNIVSRATEMARNKILTEQRGKPLFNDNIDNNN